jgi:hypothetical protein
MAGSREKDPVPCELARVLRAGRSRMPPATFEEACEQMRRLQAGVVAEPATGGAFGPLHSLADASAGTPGAGEPLSASTSLATRAGPSRN